MNLPTEINEQLYKAISSNYDKGDFTGAITDSIIYLNSIVRERTGLLSDGVVLIGEAFGGNNPKLKVTQLKTESERNVQKGVEQILRGIIQGIRNPRSHEKHNDNVNDANAIIFFINYLLKLIDKAKAPFTLEDFLKRVFDKDFVESESYAELLVSEIPEKKFFDVMMEIYNRKEEGEPNKLKFFFHSMFKRLTEDEKAAFFSIVSDELKITDNVSSIRAITEIFCNENWEKIDKAAKLRIENKLIKSVKEGIYDETSKKCLGGALGTWLSNIISHMELRDYLINILIEKLSSSNIYEHNYVFEYFQYNLIESGKKPKASLIMAIKAGLKNGDKRFYDLVFFEVEHGESDWVKKIEQEFKDFAERQVQPEDASGDELPF